MTDRHETVAEATRRVAEASRRAAEELRKQGTADYDPRAHEKAVERAHRAVESDDNTAR